MSSLYPSFYHPLPFGSFGCIRKKIKLGRFRDGLAGAFTLYVFFSWFFFVLFLSFAFSFVFSSSHTFLIFCYFAIGRSGILQSEPKKDNLRDPFDLPILYSHDAAPTTILPPTTLLGVVSLISNLDVSSSFDISPRPPISPLSLPISLATDPPTPPAGFAFTHPPLLYKRKKERTN